MRNKASFHRGQEMLSDPQPRAQKVPEDWKVTWRHVFPKWPPRSPKVAKAPHHHPSPQIIRLREGGGLPKFAQKL